MLFNLSRPPIHINGFKSVPKRQICSWLSRQWRRMSTTYSAPPPVNGSRGRHGHTRSSHRAKHSQPALSTVDLQELRNDPQMNPDAVVQSNGHAPVTNHGRHHSYTPSHIPHSGDDLSGESKAQIGRGSQWIPYHRGLLRGAFLLPGCWADEDVDNLDTGSEKQQNNR